MARIVEENENIEVKPLKIVDAQIQMNKIKSDMNKLQELRDTCDEMLRTIVCNPKQKDVSLSDLKKQKKKDSQSQEESKNY